ncbi:MAG: hypothetical protein AB7S26_26280 [Sandaracinaceae bacterium]
MRRAVVVVSLLALGCQPSEARLFLDLRTDLVVGRELDSIEITLDDAPPLEVMADPSADFLDGVRVAEWEGLPLGLHRVDIRLLAAGQEVLGRGVAIDLERDAGFTISLTRDCRGVVCDDPGASACLAGRCVPDGCTDETSDDCGEPSCTVDADCAVGAACTSVRCRGGACLYAADDAMCAPPTYCHPDLGCTYESVPYGRWALAASATRVYFAYAFSGAASIDGALETTAGDSDMFLEARREDDSLEWRRTFATPDFEWPEDMTVMPNGRLLLGGVAKNADSLAPFTLPLDGHDGFVAVLDENGGSVRWAAAVVSDQNARPDAEASVASVAASADRIYALVEFRVEASVDGTQYVADEARAVDYLLVAYEPGGGDAWMLSWVRRITAGEPRQIAADGTGVYLVTHTGTELAIDDTRSPPTDPTGFIAKVDPDGAVVFIERIGIGGATVFEDIALDDMDNPTLVGIQYPTRVTYGAYEVSVSGTEDAVVVGLAPDASVRYAVSFGEGAEVEGHRIARGPTGTLYWSGVALGAFSADGVAIGAASPIGVVYGVIDEEDGTLLAGGGLPLDASDGPWPVPDAIAGTTNGAVLCVAGRAADRYDASFYAGSARYHRSCGAP